MTKLIDNFDWKFLTVKRRTRPPSEVTWHLKNIIKSARRSTPHVTSRWLSASHLGAQINNQQCRSADTCCCATFRKNVLTSDKWLFYLLLWAMNVETQWPLKKATLFHIMTFFSQNTTVFLKKNTLHIAGRGFVKWKHGNISVNTTVPKMLQLSTQYVETTTKQQFQITFGHLSYFLKCCVLTFRTTRRSLRYGNSEVTRSFISTGETDTFNLHFYPIAVSFSSSWLSDVSDTIASFAAALYHRSGGLNVWKHCGVPVDQNTTVINLSEHFKHCK